MKSSPIATRLEYIYARRIHREERRKNTHTETHTEVRYQTFIHTRAFRHTVYTEPTSIITHTQTKTRRDKG